VSAGKMLKIFSSKPCNLFPSVILKNLGLVPPPLTCTCIYLHMLFALCATIASVYLGFPPSCGGFS
jgi:hypothetical protein